MPTNISNLRSEYKQRRLNKEDLNGDPLIQFEQWLHEAIKSDVFEPTAMTLATVSDNGKPSARIVLLKSFDTNGFSFFTNYESRKGRELAINPNAALVFYWRELERQVRVEGVVSKTDTQSSEKYFNSRPEQSRISAIISSQSNPIPNREYLENRVKEFHELGEQIVRPKFWGGFVLNPSKVEFWQGRENRLHDRFLYEKANKIWKITRLAP